AGVSFYSAGLYAGVRRSSILTRAAGAVLVLFSSLLAASVNGFLAALAIDMGIAAVLMTAAGANFLTGSDFDGQPIWGRIANVLSVMPAVLLAAALATMIGQVLIPDAPIQPRRFTPPPEAFVTADGRIALIHRDSLDHGTGLRPILSITDVTGKPLPGADTAVARRTGAETYQVSPIAADSSWLPYLEAPSFRDSRAWIKRI